MEDRKKFTYRYGDKTDCPICGQTLSSENAKPYPIPEEDSFIPPDDDSAEVKYIIKGKKS